MGVTIRRCVVLLSMVACFIFLVVSAMSTHWRLDYDPRFDVYVTLGLWRICRDIKFGATLDHQCSAGLSNDAPAWFQCVRAFILISIILTFIAFVTSLRLIYNTPATTKGYPPPHVSLIGPALVMVFATGCAFLGILVFAISTSTGQALYFPDGLEPTWGDSWADIWSQRGSLPLTITGGDSLSMTMKYGYSFALGCVSVCTTTVTFIITCVINQY